MSVVPTDWSEPDSRPGFYYDLFWSGLAVVVLGAIAYWEPFGMAVSVTVPRLVGATLLGGVFSVALTYASFGSERLRQYWADFRVRFAGLFVFIVAGQFALRFAPTWTLFTLLATVLAFIPLRVIVYVRAT